MCLQGNNALVTAEQEVFLALKTISSKRRGLGSWYDVVRTLVCKPVLWFSASFWKYTAKVPHSSGSCKNKAELGGSSLKAKLRSGRSGNEQSEKQRGPRGSLERGKEQGRAARNKLLFGRKKALRIKRMGSEAMVLVSDNPHPFISQARCSSLLRVSWRWCWVHPKLARKQMESDLKIVRQKINNYLDLFYKPGCCNQLHGVYSEPASAHGAFRSTQPPRCVLRLNPSNAE